MNEQMMMFQQIMKAPNKIGMIENLIKKNPQLSNAWQMAQQLSSNTNKEEVVNQIAKQKGITVEDVKQMAKSYGINI